MPHDSVVQWTLKSDRDYISIHDTDTDDPSVWWPRST